MIYVYAIIDGRSRPPLRELRHGQVAAVYSDDIPADPEPTEEALREHERVLERLMDSPAILPLRFGSTVADEDELQRLLASRHDEFAVSLARVRGRVEMGVRAAAFDTGRARVTSGLEYIAAKLERRRAAADIAGKIHHELTPLAHSSSSRLTMDPQPMFAGAYLVDRDSVDNFLREFDAACERHPGAAIACTGPWPPFSFANAEEAS